MIDPDREKRLDELTDQMIAISEQAGKELAEATKAPPIMRPVNTLKPGSRIMHNGDKLVVRAISWSELKTVPRVEVRLTLAIDDGIGETPSFVLWFGQDAQVEITTPNIDRQLRANIREALEKYV